MNGFNYSQASRSLLRAAARGISRQAGTCSASASASISTSGAAAAASRWMPCCAFQSPGRGAALRRTEWAGLRTCRRLDGGRRTFFAPKIVRDYEELPKDYRDQAGLAFSGRQLSEAEADQIFGAGVGGKRANHLLRILHGRRVAGTLEDPAFAIHTAQFTDEEMARALAYLRKTVPVEEIRNAGLRAEDELEQMERDVEQAAEKKAGESKGEGEGEGEEDAVEAYAPDPIYGRSKIDEMRARNRARNKARQKALEEELKAKEAAGAVSGPLAKRDDQAREITNPRVAEYYKAAQSGLEAPPDLKPWERILPSAAVVALVLGFIAAVAMVYEEPAPRYRLFREVSTSHATVGALIAMNALAYLGWRLPPLWSLFNRYMIFVVATVRPVTLFTAAFSHTKLSHLLVNMVPLWFVGTCLHDEIGRADFLALYLGCGSVGFLGSLATYTLRGWLTVTSLGASGATLGLCSAYFWEHRTDGFKIFGLPQDGVHGIVFLALITAVQLAGLGKTVKLKVDIASHLAGMAAGILGIELLNRTERRKAGSGEEKAVIDIFSGGTESHGVADGKK
ncbi:rhomboid family [Trichoderma cornu-damae]|uniref:Rhomboid family n=1 Tax=Trichoderma cornu-damae TaxID=654480 RepID=A0A9P8QQC6_9HYPO|nr:rhomboid family [Trichoderma cornu-damae]